jgi:hypothetical protein
MEDDPEETKQRKFERDMGRIPWILLPITIVFFLLLAIEHLWLLRK